MNGEKKYLVGIWTWKRLAILFAGALLAIAIIVLANNPEVIV